ncbi:MAG: glycosyltransferase, partial [Desulfobacterales bacterium]|nr:glycosyltransferase [Desulfobacterales bacterium]
MSVEEAHIKPEISLSEPLPARFAVGRGQYQILQGKINCAGQDIKALRVNQIAERTCRVELFPGREPGTLEFFISILWLPADVGKQHKLAVALLGRDHYTQNVIELGNVELVESYKVDTLPGSTLGDLPLIAICLASYNPDPARFARQIESIMCQSYENWVLIVSDDNSDQANWPVIEALCKLDPRRIRLYFQKNNVGFYRNFERALAYVPDNAELIALADQDDEWYPEKLQKLVDELDRKPGAMLAYSDMRIVTESGKVISNSYWQNRNNEYRDFNTVFIANTVTGAASLFRSELLGVMLPFPDPVGEAFHDHWVACTAMCAAKMAYVPEPLYDYVQYSNSVIGHSDFSPVNRNGINTMKSAEKWQQVYRQECLRLQFIASTLKTRVPQRSSNSTLNLMNGGLWSAIK